MLQGKVKAKEEDKHSRTRRIFIDGTYRGKNRADGKAREKSTFTNSACGYEAHIREDSERAEHEEEGQCGKEDK